MKYLDELKSIKPKNSYTLQSRAEILTAEFKPGMDWQIFMKHAVLAGIPAMILILIVSTRVLDDGKGVAQIPSLDMGGLKAEAESLDAQMKLLALTYENPATPPSSAVIREVLKAASNDKPQAPESSESTVSIKSEATSTATSTASSTAAEPELLTISSTSTEEKAAETTEVKKIDDILDELSE